MSGQKLATAFVEIRAMIDQLKPDLQKGTNFVQNWLGSIQGMAAAIGVGLGIHELSSMFSTAVHSFEEATNIAESLKAVLIGNGEAAGFAFEQMNTFASALEANTTIADDAWLAVMRTISRFDSVTGSVFKRAVERSGDLAIALGQGPGGASGIALQLGKALEDPAHGLTRLIRLGVKFTEEEKKRIKSLATSGQLLEAQEEILAKLEKFKGAATLVSKTDVGQLAQARNALDNLYEALGARVIPLFTAAVRIQQAFVSALTYMTAVFSPLIKAFVALDKVTFGWLGSLIVAAAVLVTTVASIVAGVAVLGAMIAGIGAAVTAISAGIAAFVAVLAVPLATFAAVALMATAIVAVIGAAITTVLAISGALIYWVVTLEAVQKALVDLGEGIYYVYQVISGELLAALGEIGTAFMELLGPLFGWRDSFAESLASVIRGLTKFMRYTAEIVALIVRQLGKIPVVIRVIREIVLAFLQPLFLLGGMFMSAISSLYAWGTAFATVLAGALGHLVNFVVSALGLIYGFISALAVIPLALAAAFDPKIDFAKVLKGLQIVIDHELKMIRRKYSPRNGTPKTPGPGSGLPNAPTGFIGFEDLSKKFQEALIKANDPTAALVGLGETNNKLTEELLVVTKDMRDKVAAGGLETAHA